MKGQVTEMGLAAAQARLLSITSRMSDNELRAQLINNKKIRLANESARASEKYLNALNNAKLMFRNFDDENAEANQQLTFNALTTYGPYNTQYGLINSNGQMLVSEDMATKFEAANGDLEKFLEQFGLTKTSHYFEGLVNKYGTDETVQNALSALGLEGLDSTEQAQQLGEYYETYLQTISSKAYKGVEANINNVLETLGKYDTEKIMPTIAEYYETAWNTIEDQTTYSGIATEYVSLYNNLSNLSSINSYFKGSYSNYNDLKNPPIYYQGGAYQFDGENSTYEDENGVIQTYCGYTEFNTTGVDGTPAISINSDNQFRILNEHNEYNRSRYDSNVITKNFSISPTPTDENVRYVVNGDNRFLVQNMDSDGHSTYAYATNLSLNTDDNPDQYKKLNLGFIFQSTATNSSNPDETLILMPYLWEIGSDGTPSQVDSSNFKVLIKNSNGSFEECQNMSSSLLSYWGTGTQFRVVLDSDYAASLGYESDCTVGFDLLTDTRYPAGQVNLTGYYVSSVDMFKIDTTKPSTYYRIISTPNFEDTINYVNGTNSKTWNIKVNSANVWNDIQNGVLPSILSDTMPILYEKSTYYNEYGNPNGVYKLAFYGLAAGDTNGDGVNDAYTKTLIWEGTVQEYEQMIMNQLKYQYETVLNDFVSYFWNNNYVDYDNVEIEQILKSFLWEDGVDTDPDYELTKYFVADDTWNGSIDNVSTTNYIEKYFTRTSQGKWVFNPGSDMQNFSDIAQEIAKAYILNDLFEKFGDPTWSWVDAADPNYGDADAKVQWYTNLFNKMKNEGYTVLLDGLAASTQWIEYALESGLVTMTQVDSENNWKNIGYANCADITEATDDYAVTVAEAEYKMAIQKIQAKDQRFDMELKNIDTEHTALQTEMDSIKTAMNKHIERTFKYFM